MILPILRAASGARFDAIRRRFFRPPIMPPAVHRCSPRAMSCHVAAAVSYGDVFDRCRATPIAAPPRRACCRFIAGRFFDECQCSALRHAFRCSYATTRRYASGAAPAADAGYALIYDVYALPFSPRRHQRECRYATRDNAGAFFRCRYDVI